MIRKFGTLDAAPAEVRELFLRVEDWPQWMPTVRATRVVDRNARRILLDVDRSRRGLRTTRLELIPHGTGYRERQISGPAKKWEADWRFTPAPDGRGTVAACRLDVELGFIGLFAPRRTVQRTLDRTFDRIMSRARKQLSAQSSRAAVAAATELTAPRISVYATATELEIWIGNRKYVATVSE